ncbi:MAG: plasmid mobilization relaxosome protein MobC [Mariprofundus sp.]|nr:plasmid mobilization relaxosome protein MobC [Mariprofundus sp.]
MTQAITISVTALAKFINATPQAVKKHLKKLNIEPIGFADVQKKRPLYSANIVKKMKDCKARKNPVPKPIIKSIRLSEAENNKLSVVAKKYNMSVGEILKDSAFRKDLKAKPIKQIKVADPVLLRQLSSIGNNINQIAKTLNQARKAGVISSALVTACYSTLADIDEQMSGLI